MFERNRISSVKRTKIDLKGLVVSKLFCGGDTFSLHVEVLYSNSL